MTPFQELPNPQRRALDLVKEVAVEKDCRPFLVGGPVRDILLGRHALDVDLTLEEGSSTLARAIAKRIEGRLRSFPQFLTYKITADGLPEIDIATARKERYRKPGALPAVAPGRLKDDLLRRDFSINAIAMDLMNGALHDPTGGGKDLDRQLVRILHERSFIDDPTRIYRAIRLARRLGFTLEAGTERLMAEAIDGGALSSISRERIWRELFLAMDEEHAPLVLTELNDRGALAVLFGERADARATASLGDIREQLTSNPDLDRYVLYTGALLRGSEATPAQLEGSGFSQKRSKTVLQIARDLSRFQQALEHTTSERQRFRLYKSVAPEMLTAVVADRPDEGAHLQRFHEYRNFKLPLRGNDLEVPGGPHVAKALERTREAVWTGEIPPEKARSFARELAMQYLTREQTPEQK
jgi:tRNA nucleotidyltransferase (CCA-adding enzyme)